MSAKITWSPPKEINGDSIYFEVHWLTESTIDGVRQKGEQTIQDTDRTNESLYSTSLNKLIPNEMYSIWIRAYTIGSINYSESDIISIHTFPEPEDVVLVNVSAYTIDLHWNLYKCVKNWSLQLATIGSNLWSSIENEAIVVDQNKGYVNIMLTNLDPKTQYKIRAVLEYPNYPEDYVWPTHTRYTYETLGKL